jgi:hypothetical protein
MPYPILPATCDDRHDNQQNYNAPSSPTPNYQEISPVSAQNDVSKVSTKIQKKSIVQKY